MTSLSRLPRLVVAAGSVAVSLSVLASCSPPLTPRVALSAAPTAAPTTAAPTAIAVTATASAPAAPTATAPMVAQMTPATLAVSAPSRGPNVAPSRVDAAAPDVPASMSAPRAMPAPPARDTVRRPGPPVTSDDELARTVIGVFGDSAALHADSATADGDAPLWDIDVLSYETHDRVAHYVKLFSSTRKDYFATRLSRGSRYEPMIRDKLRAGGMPEDLTYLALIESGYDPHAYSRAAAVGMWQFMSGTARGVGLRVDWWMDERRDPVRATDAAIRFLGELQQQFGSLYLAAAAYNGGPGRVARGLTRFAGEMEGSEGEDRFFALAEQNYLRAETKNYVPQLIAAALVAKTPEKYGITVDSVAPLSYDSVLVEPSSNMASIADAAGMSAAVMKDLNPAILRGITPPDASVWVHVPSGTGEQTAARWAALPAEQRVGVRMLDVSGSKTTVTALAAKEGITVKQLRWFNPTLRTSRKGAIAGGQQVRVPDRAVFAFARDIPDPDIERYGGSSTTTTLARTGLHVVRRGETLGGIAQRYGMSVTRVKSLNGMRGTRVIAGQTLRVSASATTSRSASRASSKSSPSKSRSASSTAKSSKSTAKKSSAKKSTAGKKTSKAKSSSAKSKATTKKSAAAKKTPPTKKAKK